MSEHFAGGTGTQQDPYQISTLDHLDNIRYHEASHFILINDIDASLTKYWNNGMGWQPISWKNDRRIWLDGNFHTILNLYSKFSEASFIRWTDGWEYGNYSTLPSIEKRAYIKNIQFKNMYMEGNGAKGLLADGCEGIIIENCMISATIKDTSQNGDRVSVLGNYVGISLISNISFISNQYGPSNTEAAGITSLLDDSTISNVYSVTNFNDILNKMPMFGIVGNNCTISNCYYDSDISGITDDQYGIPLTTLRMRFEDRYIGWDFIDKWIIPSQDYNNGYPIIINFIHSMFMGGYGTEQDPYQIGNLTQLNNIRYLEGMRHFKLVNDIDASDTVNWNNGQGWEPMWAYDMSIMGYGHKIKNLYINRPETGSVGLFLGIGYCKIYNIILEGFKISAKGDVGVLCGYAYDSYIEECNVYGSEINFSEYFGGGLAGRCETSMITKCQVNINIRGKGTAGGLIGDSYECSISKCFTEGNVSTLGESGGFIADMHDSHVYDSFSQCSVHSDAWGSGGFLCNFDGGNLNNCYSAGIVTGVDALAGLVADVWDFSTSTSTNCYWDIEKSGVSNSMLGTPLTTAQMKDKTNYIEWDFNKTWCIDTNINNGYPMIFNLIYDEFMGGDGTEQNPYQIGTLNQLNNIRHIKAHDNETHFILVNDIDASITKYWDNGKGWIPPDIFGSFNGNWHTISGLHCSDQYYGGLFNFLQANVYNLGLLEFNILCEGLVGALSCHSTQCNIKNVYSLGGKCFSYSSNCCGGLIGRAMYESVIENCYTHMDVNGVWATGGLVGEAQTIVIKNCFSAGSVTYTGNDNDVGGLVGYVDGNLTLTNSYYNSETSGQSDNVGKGTPLITSQMKDKTNYIGWDFIKTWRIDSNVGYGYPHLISPLDPEVLILEDDGFKLQIGETYYYRIRKGLGFDTSEWSNEFSITFVDTSFTGYIVERKTASGKWVEIDKVECDINSLGKSIFTLKLYGTSIEIHKRSWK